MDGTVNTIPELDTLGDRAADVWEPLLAIADLAGEDWPTRARRAATALSAQVSVDDDTVSVRLLQDVRQVFTEETIGSADLVHRLVSLEDHPWVDWRGGRPITQSHVARLLRPFGHSSAEAPLRGEDGQRLHETDVRRPLVPLSA